MSSLLNGMKTRTGRTANGAVTNISSLNECLDFFFLAGASREMSERDIISMFSKALGNDKETALKIAFWARDVRGGAGERRIFRVILKYLATEKKAIFNKIVGFTVKYGRFDDLFFDEEIIKHTIKDIVTIINHKDVFENTGLLFKWLPREKSSNKKIAKIIREALGISAKEYRKLLADNSSTVENLLSDRKFNEIDYKQVPSKAFNQYRKAFLRNDETRFEKFLEDVTNGDTKINAGAIFPVDIYKSYKSRGGDVNSVNAQWNSLPNYLEGNTESIMPVCDVSGSMGWYGDEIAPIDVSVSLGVYIAERTEGIFKDHFISFCGRPKLQSTSGSATDRFRQIERGSTDMSTNIQGVFDELLMVAKRDNLKDIDLPSKLLIISDMEFNSADGGNYWGVSSGKTNFDVIREKYNEAGYKMPTLIFWNVNGRLENSPVQKNDKDVALVSGYSPSILKSILGGEDLTPIGVMRKTIEAYGFIDELF